MSADKRDVQDILIVDNEESILALMQRQLMDLPFVIIPTSSPSEAIHLLKTREISVLLCDLMMPGQIDGNQVLSTAREYNPNVVSIVVTGATDPMTIMKAINEGGIWKSMAKPWKREELVQLVQAGVQRYTTLTRQQAQLQKLAREVTRHEKPGTKMETKIPKPKLLKKIFQDDRASSEGAVGVIGGRYKLDEALGEGGMGTVYKAHDLLLNMPVAIKVLGSSFTKNPVAEESLKEEARIAMQLSHRHIVRLHNLQKTGENYFLVMEYVPGRTLWEILTRYGKLPLGTVRQVVQVCSDALSYAHRHGVLHRDLKPANLLLSEDGVLKIIDFGVACLLDAQPEHDRVVGTPVYMSPEHIRGEKLDARTDVYSLGIILHELLTGQTPFPRNASCDEVLEMIPAQLSGLADDLLRVIGKSISPDREERYPTVQAFAAALMDVARSS